MGSKPRVRVVAVPDRTEIFRPDVLPDIPSHLTASTMGNMTEASPHGEISRPAPDLRLLVERPSWPRVFFGNLRDLVLPRRLPPLELQSAPAPFWPDVFVTRQTSVEPISAVRCLSRFRIRAAGWIHSLLRASARSGGDAGLRPRPGHLLRALGIPSSARYSERGGGAAGQG